MIVRFGFLLHFLHYFLLHFLHYFSCLRFRYMKSARASCPGAWLPYQKLIQSGEISRRGKNGERFSPDVYKRQGLHGAPQKHRHADGGILARRRPAARSGNVFHPRRGAHGTLGGHRTSAVHLLRLARPEAGPVSYTHLRAGATSPAPAWKRWARPTTARN